MDEIIARLKEVTHTDSDIALSNALGRKESAVSSARARKTIPSNWLVRVSEDFGVSLEWLKHGTGPVKRGEGPVAAKEEAALYKDTPGLPALRMVPKRKARLCAGTGSLTTDETVTGYYAFRHEFLARKGNPAAMALVDVYGDSMSPEICDGDTVLVDESQCDILAGRIYAVGMGDEVVIKELYKKPGKLLLISKNPAYGIEEIDLAEVDGLVRIVGRVLWWCREAR